MTPGLPHGSASAAVGPESRTSSTVRHIATATPERIVATLGSATYRYGDIDAAADALAGALIAKLGDNGARVVIESRDLEEWLVAMLAVDRAGMAFLGADESTHRDRLMTLAEDLGCSLLISSDPHSSLAGLERLAPLGHPAPADRPLVLTDEPLLLMATSGSTGRPKCVAWGRERELQAELTVELLGGHPGTYARVLGSVSTLFLSSITTALLFGDVAFFDIVEQPLARLPLWIEERKVASIFLFPSMVRAMLADDPPRSTFASLRSLWLSGEPVTRADEELMARFLPPSTMVTSIYSSTETGLVATSTASLAERRTRTSPPPFVPAPDRQVDILDELGVHVAVGDVGELVVRSPVMGRGYLPEDPRRTGTFEPHDDGTTTIRTCDAGRREEGGTFSLAGRLDRMVKIRGYRVELGEVEAVLGEVPGIADRTVIAIPGRRGDTRLVAFVEAAAGVALDESSVRRRLLERLPRHFVPDRVIELDRLPRLQSGKVARHQLPPVTRTMATGLEPPRSDIEAHIAAIVRRTLDLDVVGVEADLFFDLGADSLDVQEIFVAMSDDIGIDLPLSLAAEARTIRDLGALAAASSLVERPIVVRPGAPTATPLVMVHGAYGSVLFASTIAAGLPHNVGVHGLALPHAIATGVEAPPRTLAELAQRHLSTLRSVQPRGPYRVGGFSAGGAIALEMAAILEEEGEQVELVVMLDTPRQGSAIGAADGAVLSRGVENRLLLGRLREGGLRGVPRVLAVQRVREAGRRAARRELRRFHRDGGTVAPFARHAYLGALMHRLVREHVPTRPVTTPVLYVSAQATSYGPPGADAARGPLEVVEFPTDHEHLVDTTWGPQVGAVIGQHLHSDDV